MYLVRTFAIMTKEAFRHCSVGYFEDPEILGFAESLQSLFISIRRVNGKI